MQKFLHHFPIYRAYRYSRMFHADLYALYFEKRNNSVSGVIQGARIVCGDFVCSPTVEILHSRPWQYAAESPGAGSDLGQLLKYLESNALFFTFLLMWRQRKRI